MRALERFLLLEIIDQRWQEHLYDMDYLREGIHLRGFAQIEPLVAYKNEAFELFRDLMNSVWGDFARLIFHVQVTLEDPNAAAPPPQRSRPSPSRELGHRRRTRFLLGRLCRRVERHGHGGRGRRRGEAAAQGGQARGDPGDAGRRAAAGRRVRADRPQRSVLVRRGKKFKKCHGA